MWLFGKNKRRREEKRRLASIRLTREVAALRNESKTNALEHYEQCKYRAGQSDPLARSLAIVSAKSFQNNLAIAKKCDRTLNDLQNGEMRRRSGGLERLKKLEFDQAYREVKRDAQREKTSRLRTKSIKFDKYRSIRNVNRGIVTDCLHDGGDHESDDEDDDEDVVNLVEALREQQIVDDLLAAPNPLDTLARSISSSCLDEGALR